jgi:hypothetical protein
VPGHLVSNHGAESTAKPVRAWLRKVGVTTLYIEPDSPWATRYIERFNGRLRDDLLNGDLLTTLLETRVLIERLQNHSNTAMRLSSLGRQPPTPSKITSEDFSATLRSPLVAKGTAIGITWSPVQASRVLQLMTCANNGEEILNDSINHR